MESKINYLRENYKSTKNYIVTWEHSYIPKEDRYMYFLYIRYTGLNSTVLFKSSVDYMYLTTLFDLFMKDF
jgi:hypothetical protein